MSLRSERRTKRRGRGQRAEGAPAATDILKVLKALKEALDHALTLTALARKVSLKVGPCQDICQQLSEEGLLEIEPDPETGNDLIKLSAKGMGLS
ncbi:MAG: hypothetical protein HY730_03440 [Candidatus Tectomicrobia bacterium]|uniref:Uncharacterized protein n=1 Tax=Tectimicrobiota bacterium TaxID=2528274 RepID=A0A933GMD1_UNCTE|nr:hypothetical protein [Candidatus Tectomicrobia bacterium]